MKKIFAILLIATFAFAADSNQFKLDNFAIDTSGNVTQTGTLSVSSVTLNGQVALKFAVAVDTTSITPTAAGQVILGDDYNLYVSSSVGGSWYKVGGK